MKRKKWLLMLAVCMALCAGIFGKSGLKAEAADNYKRFDTEAGKIVKDGKYYFKLDVSGNLYMSNSKNGTYKAVPLVGYGLKFSNGKQAYYVVDNVLHKFVYASRKATALKKIKKKGDEYYNISAVYGNRIFLTKSSFDQWRFWTYSYDVKTKKLKKVKTDCRITDRYGKYVLAQKEYRSDVSPYTITLYKITSKGLSKVRTLTTLGKDETFAGGKIYYVTYPKGRMDKATLYRCNAKTGKSKKKIKTFSAGKSSAGYYYEVFVTDITSKSCKVYTNGTTYKYTYSTGKMKKISNSY